VVLTRVGRITPAAGAAAAALSAIFLSAAASPEALGLPIALLALSGLAEGEDS